MSPWVSWDTQLWLLELPGKGFNFKDVRRLRPREEAMRLCPRRAQLRSQATASVTHQTGDDDLLAFAAS